MRKSQGLIFVLKWSYIYSCIICMIAPLVFEIIILKTEFMQSRNLNKNIALDYYKNLAIPLMSDLQLSKMLFSITLTKALSN